MICIKTSILKESAAGSLHVAREVWPEMKGRASCYMIEPNWLPIYSVWGGGGAKLQNLYQSCSFIQILGDTALATIS